MLIPILIGLYIIIALLMVVSLLLNGVRPSKTLAWLLAIFTIPVAGALLYILFGRNRRKIKMFSLKNQFNPLDELENAQCHSELSANKQKITSLINNTSKCPVTCLNELELLKDGKNTFESIFEALEEAKEHIHLQYYIFEDGILADKLLEVFERKVAENVTVRLLYDGIGSYSLSKKYLKRLKQIGVETAQFLPFKFGRFLSALNYRNHRKIIVIDNKVGFTGGINISDKYLKGDPALGKWHDTHLRIEGEAVDYLNRVFVGDWYLASENKVDIAAFKVHKAPQKGTSLQIVPSGPDDDFDVMEQAFFSIINSAEKYLYIVNPYIIPNHAILQALITAALSGVDVRILMSSSTDIKLVDWCVRAYYESYLKAGIKIYLYDDGFLHSKVMLCDDEIASIGTANLDNRSLQQNYEAQVFVYDPALCKRMKSDFLKDCEKSTVLTDYEKYKKRPWIKKLAQGFAKLLSPLL
ncbi:cardiolipin synthase [Flagellimonas halotolerans]|uniref:Cardiolipin synthase n=1 Tax=Flagellimonas halotolerans TaxID=3112164 RepID=A0ABU6IT43_9FLAO|nr:MULTISPECIES: cardiolipin synthase [unclassified Allomuricauda]MEC3966443.1 cardiolipin synthase [Muricauda sp. SYSU M86414]MEC4266308.1 cardiolipin synthase [Muricauda sp. SYSU M84420]